MKGIPQGRYLSLNFPVVPVPAPEIVPTNSSSDINLNNFAFNASLYRIRWKKWTPTSDKINRRRCQDERDSARKVYEGV